jgi:hypothetical protein
MNAHLPAWIERLLDIHNQPGEGTLWHLQDQWSWPAWLTLLGLAAIGAWVVGLYLREGGGARQGYKLALAGLRLAVIGLVLVMIAQWALSFQRTGVPYVAVILDDSLSMTIADHYDAWQREAIQSRLEPLALKPFTRWNLAQAVLTEKDASLLAGMAGRYKLRFYYLTGPRTADAESPAGLAREIRAHEPLGEHTRLGAGVEAVLGDLRGSPPAALVLLTDGINTDGPALAEAAALARRKGVPLFTVGLGDNRPSCDLRISDLLVDDVAFVNDIIQFEFKLTGVGLSGRKVEVVLRQEGRPEVLGRVEATVAPDGQSQTLRIPYRPTAVGKFRYQIEVPPQEGEFETDNNRQTHEIEVRKQKIRVLLAQAEPSYEFRYLRNMLARDETIELHTVLQEADVEHTQQDQAALRVFPVRREELFAYDVIILGDVNPALLSETALTALAEFVTQKGKGGAMILIAGPKYMPAAYRDTPLAPLLPIDPRTVRYPQSAELKTGFHVQPTELGLSTPGMQLGDTPAETAAIWKNLPPLYWSIEAGTLKPGARVLAEDPARPGPDGHGLPLITMQYVGAGRVMLQAFDESWRWRWRLGDTLFARYWIQTIRYLARSALAGDQTAELSTDRREYQRGETVHLRLRFADERLAPAEDNGVTVVVEHPGHSTQRMKLNRLANTRGLFEGALTATALGNYHAWVAIPALPGRAPAADFTVAAPPGEFQHTRMESAELQQAAEQTKGHFYTFSTTGRLLADLPEGRQVPIETLPPKTIWNRWPILALLLALLIAEWILRKRGGMV